MFLSSSIDHPSHPLHPLRHSVAIVAGLCAEKGGGILFLPPTLALGDFLATGEGPSSRVATARERGVGQEAYTEGTWQALPRNHGCLAGPSSVRMRRAGATVPPDFRMHGVVRLFLAPGDRVSLAWPAA